MTDAVLDASAVLAAILGEPGASAVANLTGLGLLSTVNYAEVRTRLSDLGVADSIAEKSIAILGLEIVAFDLAQAQQAAGLRQATRSLGLSLGDRACLALAAVRKLPAVTADRAWQQADLSIDIQIIR